jgi:hypothetical protein
MALKLAENDCREEHLERSGIASAIWVLCDGQNGYLRSLNRLTVQPVMTQKKRFQGRTRIKRGDLACNSQVGRSSATITGDCSSLSPYPPAGCRLGRFFRHCASTSWEWDLPFRLCNHHIATITVVIVVLSPVNLLLSNSSVLSSLLLLKLGSVPGIKRFYYDHRWS